MLSDSKISSLYFEALGSQHLREQDRTTVSRFALAVEAEARAQDTALIRQLVEALDLGHSFGIECCNSFAERMNGRRQDQLTQLLAEAEQILNAAKAGRARLEGKPTEPPKEPP